MKSRITTHYQKDISSSAWSNYVRAKFVIWHLVWLCLFRPTPKPFSRWRCFLLRLFGAKIDKKVFIAQSVKIKIPWHLTLHQGVLIGPYAEIYNLGHVTMHKNAMIAQHVYLCAGSHDLSQPHLPLMTGPIVLEEYVWVGAKAFVMPGITLKQGAVLAACAMAVKDLDPWSIYGGNPAKFIKKRIYPHPNAQQPTPDPNT